jgi:hypothetical protein
MPLNASGPISLGGATAGESVNLELAKAATSTVSFNDIDVRTLAAVGSGTISLYDFYGKSSYVYGQDEFISAGTYTWTCPDDVTSISVVCVGGGGGGDAGSDLVGVGGGGGGGALAYRNNVTVIPRQQYTIVVGAGGMGQVTVARTTTQASTVGGQTNAFSCIAGGGSNGSRGTAQVVIGSLNAAGGQIAGVYDGGSAGGFGGTVDTSTEGFRPPGGGGAAGYAGLGGYGGRGKRPTGSLASAASLSGEAAATNGGGGGGGGAGYTSDTLRVVVGANGGGVGIYGKGVDGVGGSGGNSINIAENGGDGSSNYGGIMAGSGGGGGVGGDNRSAANGLDGAVRIIWPGQLRQFPLTGTQNA